MRFIAFILLLLGSFHVASASVIMSEIAWMGNAESSTNEWIELSNTGTSAQDLTGWILRIEGKKDIALSGTITPSGYYLIERTDDNTVSNVTADLVTTFGTGLSNDGALLTLLNEGGAEVDRVNGVDGWKLAGGNVVGDNTTKDTAQRSGAIWVTGTPTPKAVNTGATQVVAPTSPASSGGDATPSTQSINTTSLSVSAPGAELFTDAGPQTRTVIAGAPIVFSGTAWNSKKDAIDYAGMVWSFGDGALGEGTKVSHVYYYPGDYTVVLDTSLGVYRASDRILVSVVAPNLLMSAGGVVGQSFIKIENKGSVEIDMSLWQVGIGSGFFTIPRNTILGAGKTLTFASQVTGLSTPEGSAVVLKFPHGELVPTATYAPKQEVSTEYISTPTRVSAPPQNYKTSREEVEKIPEQTQKAEVLGVLESVAPSKSADMWSWYTGVALLGALALLAMRFVGRRVEEKVPAEADEYTIEEEQ